jgi:hypothetical protein
MWARVKGETENAILDLGFHGAYAVRPGLVEPLHGIKTRTTAYRIAYAILWPFVPLLKLIMPKQLLTTDSLSRAMLNVAKRGASKKVLEIPDLQALGAA